MTTTFEQEGKFLVAAGAMIEHEPSGKIRLAKRADTADYLPGIGRILGVK